MIKIKSKDEGMFVDIFNEDGTRICASGLDIRWDPQRGLIATLEISLPDVDLELKEENVKIIKREKNDFSTN